MVILSPVTPINITALFHDKSKCWIDLIFSEMKCNFSVHHGNLLIVSVICILSIFYFSKTIRFEYASTIKQFVRNNIDLVIVCGGEKYCQFSIGTIKSILFFRRKFSNFIFHIITDPHGENLISNSLNLSNNSCINFRFYDIEQLIHIGEIFIKRHEIINSHYSGVYGLSKAFISEILPANLNDVLLIDTDMIFVDDIYSVWKEFQLFKRKQTALGLVPWHPRLPPNYVYRGYEPDAFITGVVLLDLNVCRSINLMELFDRALDKAHKEYGLRSLWTADQVILSLFATQYPEHVVSLPCYLNGHTYHYLKNGAQWKQACNGEYVRNIHVVPSKLLLKKDHYLGNLYRFFSEIPIEWTDHCGKE